MRRSNVILGVLVAVFCAATGACDAFVGTATAPSDIGALKCGDQVCINSWDWACTKTLPLACRYMGTMGLPTKDGGAE